MPVPQAGIKRHADRSTRLEGRTQGIGVVRERAVLRAQHHDVGGGDTRARKPQTLQVRHALHARTSGHANLSPTTRNDPFLA